jgi:chitodextrinase
MRDGTTVDALPTPLSTSTAHAARGSQRWHVLNLEFRQPWGIFDNFSAGDPVVNGVSIRIAPSTSSLVQSKLVDANASTSSFSDAALALGQSVTDPLTGVSITTLSVGPAGASVSVQFGTDSQLPSAPGSLSATPSSSTSVQLTWAAATDNIGVAGYDVYRGGALVETTSGPSLSYLDTGLSPTTAYGYEVRAYDAAGNVGPGAAASATTPAVDTQPPTAPTGLNARLQKGRKVVLTWNAATDNIGVAGYDLYRGSVQVAWPTGTTYTDRPGRGTFTYQVRARDTAGNVSGTSAPITVKT